MLDLCTSLLKNTTSHDTNTIELSLRLIWYFRNPLKTKIKAFVTNVFFVILDSKNSTVQLRLLVLTLFKEICSNAMTLAEIFLNYNWDLSAVNLFSRITNTLGKVARMVLSDATGSSGAGGGGGGGIVAICGRGGYCARGDDAIGSSQAATGSHEGATAGVGQPPFKHRYARQRR